MAEPANPRVQMQGSMAQTENMVLAGALDIFRLPIQEQNMINRSSAKVRPAHDKSPFVFTVPNYGNSYIDLPATRANFTFKVVDANGKDLTEEDNANVSVVNMMGTSLISRVDVQIGGRAIPDLQTMHHNYKAYVEAIMSYSSTAKNSQLRSVGWWSDDATHYDEFEPNEKAIKRNYGYQERKKWVRQSRLVETVWPLHSDFFQMGGYLVPHLEMTVTLYQASDDFLILTGEAAKKYKVVVTDVFLEFFYIDVSPELHKSNMATLMHKPLSIPINVTEVHTKPIGMGPKNLRWDIVTGGIVPKKVIIMFLRSEAFNGSQERNPYRFSPHGLNYLQLRVNSRSYPDDPYTTDFAKELCMRPYRGIFDNIGFSSDDAGNSITFPQFLDGMTIFPFDLTADHCNGYHNHGPKYSGTVTLDARFNEDLNNITVMAIVSWDGHFKLDHALNAWVDRCV